MKIKSRKKIIKVIYPLVAFFVLLIFLLTFIQLNILEKVKNNFRDPEYLLIKDECALIMGNLIHKIQNEGECKIACQNSCKIKEYFYFNSTFVPFNNQCNTCDCYCK